MINLIGTNSNNIFKINKNSLTNNAVEQNHYVLISSNSLQQKNTFENYNYKYFNSGTLLVSATGVTNTLFEKNITTKNFKNDYLVTTDGEKIWSSTFTKSLFDTNINYYQNFVKSVANSNLIETKNYYLANTSIPSTRTELGGDNGNIDFVIGGNKGIGTWSNTENSVDNKQKVWIENVVANNTTTFNIGGPIANEDNRKVVFQSYSYDTGFTNQNLDNFKIKTNIFSLNDTLTFEETVSYNTLSSTLPLKVKTSTSNDIEFESGSSFIVNTVNAVNAFYCPQYTKFGNSNFLGTQQLRISTTNDGFVNLSVFGYETIPDGQGRYNSNHANENLIFGNANGTQGDLKTVVFKTEGFETTGFTKLGSNAPAIKTKLITGTLPIANSSATIDVGIDASKILSDSLMILNKVRGEYQHYTSNNFGDIIPQDKVVWYYFNNDITFFVGSAEIIANESTFKLLITYIE